MAYGIPVVRKVVVRSSPMIPINHRNLGSELKKDLPPKRSNRGLNRNRESWPGLKNISLWGTAHKGFLKVS